MTKCTRMMAECGGGQIFDRSEDLTTGNSLNTARIALKFCQDMLKAYSNTFPLYSALSVNGSMVI